jgi:hypothetical protein
MYIYYSVYAILYLFLLIVENNEFCDIDLTPIPYIACEALREAMKPFQTISRPIPYLVTAIRVSASVRERQYQTLR